MKNILFLCTGNSARSIMAEAYMNHAGGGEWRAYSAGSKPTGTPNPFAIKTLEDHQIDAAEVGDTPRSKSWDEFAENSAPIMDVVVTVCDNAAGETCPVWPRKNGQDLVTLHWSFPDPAAAQGDDELISAAFEEVFSSIRAALDDFLADQQGAKR